MAKIEVAVLVVLLVVPAHAQGLRNATAVMVAGQAADTITTCANLSQGGREANRLLPNHCKGIALVKTGVTLSVYAYGRWAAHYSGNNKSAKLAFYLVGLVGFYAAAWNLSQHQWGHR